MACKMLQLAALEADKETEVNMRVAFELHQPRLKPPFLITNLTPAEYLHLNQALVYGVLCESSLAGLYIKLLHGIVTDGYACFVGLLVNVVNELYPKLVVQVKFPLIWVLKEMIYVNAVGTDVLILSLLRQIVGGDFSDPNLWLCHEMVTVLSDKLEWLIDEEPLVVPSVLFVFLRLLSDHCMPSVDVKVAPLRRKEIDFCVRLLREKFHLCIKIGRDLVRILQDLAHVPEFQAILKDLFSNPAAFGIPGFSDVMQIYRMRTSSRYFLLRLTPEMEAHIRFLLTYVKLGNQRRYLDWFSKKFLSGPEKEGLICDIVRFICCAHHPSNEIIQSTVIPRWAVIGWLLKYCQKNYEVANVKLALFYDWLFFDEGSDNIMNIEPAMLLMVHSIPQYTDVTHTLLEFLILMTDRYDTQRRNEVTSGVMSSFSTLAKKGVVRSLDVQGLHASCELLHPYLKERLQLLLKPIHPIKDTVLRPATLAPCVNSSTSCRVETERSSLEAGEKPNCFDKDRSSQELSEALGAPSDVQVSPCILIEKEKPMFDATETLYQTLCNDIRKSYAMGRQSLGDLLNLLAEIDYQDSFKTTVEAIFDKILTDFESNGYKLFSSDSLLMKDAEGDFDVQSTTALILHKLITSPCKSMLEVFAFLSSKGYPVRELILLFSLRLVYEVQVGRTENLVSDNLLCADDRRIALLKFHIDELKKLQIDTHQTETSKPDSKTNLLDELLARDFTAYRSYLSYSKTTQNNGLDGTLVELLAYDLLSCFEWDDSRLSFKLGSIFYFLPDLSVGQEVFIRLLLIRLSHVDVIDLQFQLALKKLVVFGNNTDVILLIIKNSLRWDNSLQYKLWGILRSELVVSNLKLETLVLEFFGSEFLDSNSSSIAVEGLLTLCCCRGPTPELVGAIILLPNHSFQGFSAAVLSTWAATSSSLLFNSLAAFVEKLKNTNNGSILSENGIMMNQSTILWILNCCDTKGLNVDILRKLSSVMS